jgi:hypothetical protein
MEQKLELVLIPVADVDRAKALSTEKLGFNLDVDISSTEGFRVVQMMPPGSASSITSAPASRISSPVLIGERTWSSRTSRPCVASSWDVLVEDSDKKAFRVQWLIEPGRGSRREERRLGLGQRPCGPPYEARTRPPKQGDGTRQDDDPGGPAEASYSG